MPVPAAIAQSTEGGSFVKHPAYKHSVAGDKIAGTIIEATFLTDRTMKFPKAATADKPAKTTENVLLLTIDDPALTEAHTLWIHENKMNDATAAVLKAGATGYTEGDFISCEFTGTRPNKNGLAPSKVFEWIYKAAPAKKAAKSDLD